MRPATPAEALRLCTPFAPPKPSSPQALKRPSPQAPRPPGPIHSPTRSHLKLPAAQPGCDTPRGDVGGFRFSRDGGRTLSEGARRLANVAYTWAIKIDPRDPDDILELHAGRLDRSRDAGCTFAVLGASPSIVRTADDGASWDKVDAAMREGGGGSPPQPIIDVVGVSVTFAPGDADSAYDAVNQVARDPALRGLWRSGDGGRTWERRVVADQAVESDAGGMLPAVLPGGSRVFVSPYAPDDVFFAYGPAFGGYGTDVYRSHDGLRTLRVAHFDGFYDVLTVAWGPEGSDVVFVGASSDSPSAR